MPINQKLTDKPLRASFSNDALVHIVEPEDKSQGADGSDYRMLAKDFQAQAGQDNIDIRKNVNILFTDTYTQILAKINALANYTVNEKQSVWFICRQVTSGAGQLPRTIKYKMMLLGKGNYGVGGTQLSFDNLENIYDNTSTLLDIENNPTTDKILYGDLVGETISEWLNVQDPAIVIQPQEDGYTLFEGTINGVNVSYLWIGLGGVYGLGDTQSTMADFQIISDTASEASDDLPYLSTIQGATIDNVRNDQPSFLKLDNGDILCAFNHFGAEGSDISTAYIAGKISSDDGKTWGSIFTLQEVIPGTDNTLVPSLYKKEDGKILMLFFVGTAPVPTPTSKIYKKLFNQDLTVFATEEEIVLPTNYYVPGSERIFLDLTNGNILYPLSVLISGDGTSYGSIFKSTILLSVDEGENWADLNLNIGSDKLIINNTCGGSTEPGIFYTPTGLVLYFRTLTGYSFGVKLDEDYNPVGEEYILFPSSNAMSSIKWLSSLDIVLATRTRLIDNNPIGDNGRKYLDLLTSTDGVVFSTLSEIDHAIEDIDWYVNQAVIFENEDEIIIGYNNSKTGIKTASLFAKIYPKSFFGYNYNPEAYIGISDNGRGKLINGVQIINSTDDTRNTIAVKYPKGGYLSLNGTSDTGAIQITLPNNNEAYLAIKGVIYSNSDNSSIDFNIICNSSDMTKNTVKIDSYEITTPLNIRFVDGVNPKIFLGELASGWNKLSVLITEVVGFNDTRISDISEGWGVSLQSTSFGTVVSTKNNTLNANIRGGSFTVSNAPSGLTMYLLRAGFGALFANSSTENGYLCYDGTGSALFYRVFGNGNITIGQAAGTDTGEKLQVNGEAKVGAAVAATSAIQKGQVDTNFLNKVAGGTQTVSGLTNFSMVKILTSFECDGTFTTNQGQITGAPVGGTDIVNKNYSDGTNNVSGTGTLALATTTKQMYYTFTGTTSTWTLPVASGNTLLRYTLINAGSGNITLNSNSGGNDILDAGVAVNTKTIASGAVVVLYNNGTNFVVIQ